MDTRSASIGTSSCLRELQICTNENNATTEGPHPHSKQRNQEQTGLLPESSGKNSSEPILESSADTIICMEFFLVKNGFFGPRTMDTRSASIGTSSCLRELQICTNENNATTEGRHPHSKERNQEQTGL